MNQKKLVKIWNQVPIDYYDSGISKNVLQRLWHNRKLEVFKELIGQQKPQKILDIGCASGTMTNNILRILPKSEITAIDVYPAAIAYAQRKYPHIRFLVTDAHKLPFKDNSFDLAVCYETIEHVIDPQKVLEEIRRVIKKDGLAIIGMDSGSVLFRIVWWIWEKTKGRVWKGAHLHPFRHRELERIILDTKFKVIKKRLSHFGMAVSFLLKK